jgi:hypothetical protein
LSFREAISGTTVADRILFIFLVAVSLVGILFIKEALPRSGEAVIEVDGKMSHRYPLDTERVVEVKSSSVHLTVEIKNRMVRVVDASCPNKLCESTGWISRGAIICLPGRISVIVEGAEGPGERRIDAITG